MSSKQSEDFLKNKKILITGAAGSVGSELARQVYKMKPKELVLLDNNETGLFDIWEELPQAIPVLNDIRATDLYITLDSKFDYIFHAAAYKHVVMGEKFSDVMWTNNVDGFNNVLNLNFNKLVLISTDKAVNPDCVMGKSKKRCEELCSENCVVVRFGNVLGSRGSVIPIWQKQLDEGKALTVTDKRMKRYFMTMEEACSLVLEAGRIGRSREKFILDMGKQVSVLELAKEIIKKSGKDLKVKIIGIKPGEKFTETLMTKEEQKKAKKIGKLWKI